MKRIAYLILAVLMLALCAGIATAATNRLGSVRASQYVVTAEDDPTVPSWAKSANPPPTCDTNAVRDLIAPATNAVLAEVATGLDAKRDLTNRVWSVEEYGDWTNEDVGTATSSFVIPFTDSQGITRFYWYVMFNGGGMFLVYKDSASGMWDTMEEANAATSGYASDINKWLTRTRTSAVNLALSTDLPPLTNGLATAEAVTNIVDGRLTTNNAAFVRGVTNAVDAAVLAMVAESANTNAVAVLNEMLGGEWQTYGGGFAGLLAAILAAIAWLKKNKLTKGMTGGVPDDPNVSALFSRDGTSHVVANSALEGSVHYYLGTAITADSADKQLKDRFCNLVTVGGTDVTLTLPGERSDGTLRDFLVRIEMSVIASGDTGTPKIPSLSSWEGDELPTFEHPTSGTDPKVYLLAITETKASTWLVKCLELETHTASNSSES